MSEERGVPEKLDKLDKVEAQIESAHGLRRLSRRYLLRKIPFAVIILLAANQANILPTVLLVMGVVGILFYLMAQAHLDSLRQERDSVIATPREQPGDRDVL